MNLSIAFEGFTVRVVGTANEPEWMASDVCKILEIRNVSQALADLEGDEKGICITYTLGGAQEALTVKEPGLYRLIFKSRKPVARRLQRWVFHDVLPTLRRTGSYSMEPKKIDSTSGFSLESIRSLVESEDFFPVDFDKAWQWIDFASSQAGRKKLEINFNEGEDYLCLKILNEETLRPNKLIRLTVDCLKSLAVIAGTKKGVNVKRLVLSCERDLKLEMLISNRKFLEGKAL